MWIVRECHVCDLILKNPSGPYMLLAEADDSGEEHASFMGLLDRL